MGSHETGEIFDRVEDSLSRLHEENALKRDVLNVYKDSKIPDERPVFRKCSQIHLTASGEKVWFGVK